MNSRKALSVVVLAMVSAMASCARQEMSAPEASPPPLAGTTAEPVVSGVTAVDGVSTENIAYAALLGGTTLEGETLYFVVGASLPGEDDAREALEQAIPLFGDMQSYFIVQHSDNFQGMHPGWWVVMEAYRNRPAPEQLDFARRAFPDAYVRQATVQTSAPIPVYEDLVGEP